MDEETEGTITTPLDQVEYALVEGLRLWGVEVVPEGIAVETYGGAAIERHSSGARAVARNVTGRLLFPVEPGEARDAVYEIARHWADEDTPLRVEIDSTIPSVVIEDPEGNRFVAPLTRDAVK